MDNESARPSRKTLEAQLRGSLAEDFPPSRPALKDFLNAGMPEWMALAAYGEMKSQISKLCGTDRSNIAGKWGYYLSRYATIADQLDVF